MPEDHQKYLEWNGDRFRKWAERIGINTYTVVNAILTSKRVEQQTYRSCMGLLKLTDKYSESAPLVMPCALCVVVDPEDSGSAFTDPVTRMFLILL